MQTERLCRPSTGFTLRLVSSFGATLLGVVRYGIRGLELAVVPAGRDVLHKSAGVAWSLKVEGASASFAEGDLAREQ